MAQVTYITVKVRLVGQYTRPDAVKVGDAMAEAAKKAQASHVETTIKEDLK